MKIEYCKTNSKINFSARINLSDKAKLLLSYKKDLALGYSPVDFYYRQNKIQQSVEMLFNRVKSRVKQEQLKPTNSRLRKKVLDGIIVLGIKTNVFVQNVSAFFERKSLAKSVKNIENLHSDSPEYIEMWAKVGNSVKKKFVDINIEDGVFEKIAKTNKPTIFIMNHDAPAKDKFIYPILNSFLNYSYVTLEKQYTCPRPYIIVSHNVLERAPKKMRILFEKMGLVPIDASLEKKNIKENAVVMKDLIDKFVLNKANIFTFPEGYNSVYKNRPLKDKMQPGIAKMIKSILSKKNDVDVVPVGISYSNEKNSMGAIYVGKTINFVRQKDGLYKILEGGEPEKIGEFGTQRTMQNLLNVLHTKLSESVELSKTL